MNEYQNLSSGQATLKDVYSPDDTRKDALTEVLRQRRKRLAETKIGSVYEEPLTQSNEFNDLALRRRGF